MPTNRERAKREKWAETCEPPPAVPTPRRESLERLDNEYDLYAWREVRNERHRRGIAWDEMR